MKKGGDIQDSRKWKIGKSFRIILNRGFPANLYPHPDQSDPEYQAQHHQDDHEQYRHARK